MKILKGLLLTAAVLAAAPAAAHGYDDGYDDGYDTKVVYTTSGGGSYWHDDSYYAYSPSIYVSWRPSYGYYRDYRPHRHYRQPQRHVHYHGCGHVQYRHHSNHRR